jgi:hypothetical protein
MKKKMSPKDQRIDDIMKKYGCPKPVPYTPPAQPEFPAEETFTSKLLAALAGIFMTAYVISVPCLFVWAAIQPRVKTPLEIEQAREYAAHPERFAEAIPELPYEDDTLDAF